MGILRELASDEAGFILSSELVVLGTLGVVGATVGLNMVSRSVNEELKDLAFAIRSLDQSYATRGFSCCGAYTAGSCFTQRPVKESLAELACDVPDAKNPDAHAPDADELPSPVAPPAIPVPAVPETVVDPEA